MATATFGTIDYKENGVIVVPVNLSESVIINSKTIFEVTHVPGASLQGINYRLIGEDTDFELVFEVPADRVGSFRISANGDVLLATGTWENVVATAVVVNYDTRKPTIIDWNVPGNYEFGENFDFLVALNVPITGWHLNNTFAEVWIEEGTVLGTPTPYKWAGTNPPNIHAAVPDDLTGTDWQILASPPNPVTPGSNGFNDDGTEWHGEEGMYFLVRIEVTNADATGIPQYSLRPFNPLRGRVS